MARKNIDEKNLKKANKVNSKYNRKYSTRGQMKKRIKNSKIISNVKEIDDEGLIHLKTGEVATLIEVKATTGNTKSSSTVLNNYSAYKVKKCIKFGEYNIGESENKLTLPYYLAFLLEE